MKKMKLALLCDIDNAPVSVEFFNELTERFGKTAEIVIGKIYGYAERRHRAFAEIINANCFEIAAPMRYKKRTSQMDVRLVIDAVEIAQASYIDGFVIVGGAGDFAPLLTYLKGKGKFVAGAFVTPDNLLYCNETVNFPEEEGKEPRPAPKREERKTQAESESKEQTPASAAAEDAALGDADIFAELEKIVKEFAAKK